MNRFGKTQTIYGGNLNELRKRMREEQLVIFYFPCKIFAIANNYNRQKNIDIMHEPLDVLFLNHTKLIGKVRIKKRLSKEGK